MAVKQQGRRALRVWRLPKQGLTEPILALGCAFLLGVLSGCFAAYHMDGDGRAALQTYLTGYTGVLQAQGGGSGWGGLLWRAVRLPAAAALLGLCPLGFPALPLLVGMRGFLFSFVVSACGSCAGPEGVLAALLLFGLAQAASTAALLFIAIPGWGNARNLALARSRRGADFSVRRYLAWCGLCLAGALAMTALCHLLSLATVDFTAGLLV
ncbi:MAG: hypothetical protein LUC87_06530 [Clostridiales bacterium]|nr:hypothetical protein [Clostridiales bacterium]MCD8367546.1 hypothetical protein [Clostridiales bacterium]